MISRRSVFLPVAAAAAACLVLAGCGSARDSDSPGSASESSASGESSSGTVSAFGEGKLDDVKVTAAKGKKPKVTFEKPFSLGKTSRRVLRQGTGAEVKTGQRVSVNYVGVNGTDGKEFDTSYGKGVASFVLDPSYVIAGFSKGLVGSKVGSQIMIGVPPEDGYGTQGAPAAGIGPTDTLIFVVEIRDAQKVLTRAEGTKVTPPSGLPKVTLAKDGKPTITIPSKGAPSSQVTQKLIVGKGKKVAKGQTITVHYTGVIWPGGKKFDSSWDRGKPASFQIGVNKVIQGWDTGLVGQRVGSQVLLVIPPDQGYGAGGQPDAGIKGTDTLVFVVDILDAV